MVALYGIAVFVGAGALVTWLVAQAIADWPHAAVQGPEERFGERGRWIVSGLLGFGLGGMSASFAGWSVGLALVAALAGAGGLVAASRLLADDNA